MAEPTRTAPTITRRPEVGPDRRRAARCHLDDMTELPTPPTGGRPLPPDVARVAGARLGADLSGIRLHHDWFAHELAEALAAQAVTEGPHIYLAADAPDPATPAGRLLLAHEFVHAAYLTSSSAPAEEEAAAERAGMAAARQWDAASAATPPEPSPGVAANSSPDSGSRDDLAAASQPVDPGGSGDAGGVDHPGVLGRLGRLGRIGRLGRRTKATLVHHGSDGGVIPDVVSAGEALVRLVGRLFDRDSEDHGGRLTSVLARLETRLRDDVVTEVAARSGGHAETKLHELAHQRPPEDGGYAAGESAVAGASDSVTTADRDGSTPVPGTPDADAAAEPSAPTGMDPAAIAEQTSGAPEPAKADAPTGSGSAQAAEGDELPDQDSIEEKPPAPAALQAPTTQGAQTESGPTSPTASTAAASKPATAPAPEVPTGGEAPAAAAGSAGAGVAADSTSVAGEGPPGAGAGPATITDAAGEAPAAAATTTEATAADGASNTASDAAGAAADASSTAGSMAPTGAEAEEPQSEAETETVPEPAVPIPSPMQSDGPLASAAAAPAEVAEPTGTDPGLVGDAGPDAADQAETDATADVPTEPAGGPAEPEAGQVPAELPTADDEQGAEPDAGPQDAGSDSVQAASPMPSAPPAATLPSEPSQGGVVSPELTAETPADAAPESDMAAGTAAAEVTPVFDSDAPAAPPPSVDDPASIAAAAGISPADTGDAGTLTDPAAPSGGEGGGSAIADPPEAQAPDVSAMDPQAALGAVAGLPATKLAGSLGEVSGAAGREIAEGNADLAANPPSMERPSGVPADRDASLPPAALPPLPVGKDRVLNAIAGGPGAEPPSPAEAPTFPAPVTVRVPEVTAGGDTQVSAEDARRVQTAVRALPTSDPALDVDAGPVPQLELTGGEDPHQVEDQAASAEEATSGVQSEGLTDARADMGENDIFPQVPKETLAADMGSPGGPTVGGAGGVSPGAPSQGNAPPPGKAAAPAAGGAPATGGGKEAPPAAIDAVVAEQSADQVAGSARDQGAALGAARQDHDTSAEQAKADTDKQINDEIAANGGEQTAARRDVRTSVGQQRKDWVGEQDRIAGDSRTAAGAAAGQAQHDIGDARTTARTDAGTAIKDGNSTIVKERTKAEQSAREEREKAERESDDGGFFSWLGSKIKSFVNKIKSAIHAVFELARKAVDAAISAAQKLAVAAIELGRRAVVAAIDVAGKALMAAGDIALAAFPETRKKFRAKIQEKVDGAKNAVNELADKLKAGVKKLLDALGGLLKGALTLLEKAYTAAIDAVGKVIDSAIKAAKAFVDALLDFAALIADIAADPVQWIKNLAAGFMDGVHNYVWSSLITAVKNWFKEKVEEIVGVGSMILDLLRKGGITFVKIVSMAWTAIKESLPGIVIQLLIEKLVAMLIPAGGAISLIIDGIKAAWGAASKILAAFGKFIAFLKAVKSGKSGPLFGDLVGAAAVAVMDFLANFVLSKLKGAGQKVGGTLRKMAEKIMKAVKKVAGAIKAGAKAAVGAIKRGAKAAVGLVKKGAKAAAGALKRGAGRVAGAVKRGAKAVVRAVGRVVPKGVLRAGARAIGKVRDTVRAGYRKAKAAYTKAKEKLFGKKKPKKPKTVCRATDRGNQNQAHHPAHQRRRLRRPLGLDPIPGAEVQVEAPQEQEGRARIL